MKRIMTRSCAWQLSSMFEGWARFTITHRAILSDRAEENYWRAALGKGN